MNNLDFVNLGRTALFKAFEEERQEWLAAGMSDADVYRIHFGEMDADGKLRRPKDGGYASDYFVWLDERKHTRSDHKYSPGAPVALESVKYEGSWFSDHAAADDLLNTEQTIDIEAVLQTLSLKQRSLVRALVFDGVTAAEYAQDHHLSRSAVSQLLSTVRKNLKKFYGQP